MVCLSNRRLIVPYFVSFVSYKNPSWFSMLHIVSVAISTPDSSRSDLSSLGVLGSGFPPFKPTFEVFSILFSSSSVSRWGFRQLQVSYKLLNNSNTEVFEDDLVPFSDPAFSDSALVFAIAKRNREAAFGIV